MTQFIHLDGELVATVGARRFYLTPRVENLRAEDPTARLVTLMCAYALDVEAGRLPGPYSDAQAAAHAREALRLL